jgi:TRAP-type C4-dicarboxylate transport system permease small subunit
MPSWLTWLIKTCTKLKQWLIILEEVLAISSLLLLLILAMFQLLARNLFDTGFSQMEIITRHLILFIIFMGAALVSEQNKHIKIDVLTHFLSQERQDMLTRPLILLSAVISAVFAWYSLNFWLEELEYAPSNERWSAYMAVILPAGFSILSLHLLLITITGFSHINETPPKPVTHCSCVD